LQFSAEQLTAAFRSANHEECLEIKPFAITCLLQAFFKVTAGQTPNPGWEAKPDAASEKFKKLGERVTDWVSGGRTASSSQT
jgi:hypothetical protein